MDNANSPEYLEKIKNQVIENLRRTVHAPSVQMTEVPRDPEGMDDEADAILDDLDEDERKDQRYTKRRWDKYVEKEGELSESEDEEENGRNGVHRQQHMRKRRNILTDVNPHAVSTMDDDLLARGVRAPSHDSDGIEDAGLGAVTNGSARSSTTNPDESDASSPKSRDDSLPPGDTTMQDIDEEMADEPAAPITNGIHLAAAEGPQEATPPASPPTNPVAPILSSTVAATPDDDAMDEGETGDTLDDPEAAQENGLMEREEENANAEKATEVAEGSEQA